jgi:membrane protease YdiL (CAAX protease family)
VSLVPRIAPLPATGDGVPEPIAPVSRYVLAVAITVAAILSQYVVPELVPATQVVYGTLLGGLFVVYGIPIAAFAILVGARPLRRWAAHSDVAVWEGLRWYALLSLLGLLLLIVLVAVYDRVDPHALTLLTRPNPVLQAATGDPFFWIAFSFVIGAVEETIFRGWIFGYWLAKGTDRWELHALWSSALFAGVHLYYGTTYQDAAPLIYPTLFLTGLAFAGAVRASGGNLWVVAVLHGAHDSAAFLTLISTNAALGAEYGIIAIGAVIALIDLLGSVETPPASPAGAGAFGPPYGPPWPSYAPSVAPPFVDGAPPPFPGWPPPPPTPPPGSTYPPPPPPS